MRLTKEIIPQGMSDVEFITLCAFDFIYFRERVLGRQTPYHQKIIVSELNKKLNKETCIEVARQHGKTKTIEDWLIWKMNYNSNIKIAWLSSSMEKQAVKKLDELKEEIEENEYLAHLKKNAKVWTNDEIILKNGCSLMCVPFYSGTIRGQSLNIVVCDDILSDKQKHTHDQIVDLVFGAIKKTTITTKGQLIIIGTPLSSIDVFNKIEELYNDKLWNSFVKLPAVIIDPTGQWVAPLWPEKFTLEELSRERMQDPLRFDREMLLNPAGMGDGLYPYSVIHNAIDSNVTNKMEGFPNMQYVLGIDVAVSKEKKSDYTVLTVLGYDGNTITYTYRHRDKGMDDNKIMSKIDELNAIFNFDKIIPEHAGVGISLCQTLLQTPKYAAITFPYKTTSREKKEVLLSMLKSAFMRQIIKVPNDTTLLDELLAFRVSKRILDGYERETYESVGRHDDCVMSLALAVYGLLEEPSHQVAFELI